MSYHRRLVEYVLQQQDGRPVTAAVLTQHATAHALDSGASLAVVEAINTRATVAHLRMLVKQERARIALYARDAAHGRATPLWIAAPDAEPVESPDAPPGIPALMRNTTAEKAMADMLMAFASDAAGVLVKFQAEIDALAARHKDQYQRLKEQERG